MAGMSIPVGLGSDEVCEHTTLPHPGEPLQSMQLCEGKTLFSPPPSIMCEGHFGSSDLCAYAVACQMVGKCVLILLSHGR